MKNLLRELLGERAKNLGMVKEKAQNAEGVIEYEPTGTEFPKDKIDFLVFYKLLIIIVKLCIAKHEEAKIN